MKIPTLLTGLTCLAQAALAAKQPNILFILTDDQDLHMHSLDYMPLLQKHLVKEGTLFLKHFCTVAICCPSRVNLWTGRAAHNTNVTDVWPPYGGYPKIVSQGINNNYLPVWLQSAGYNTYYSGKLWNAHSVDNYNAPYAQGFNGSDFLLDPYTYDYRNAHMTRNGNPPQSYRGQYSPDVTASKALSFLNEALLHPHKPWFVVHAPVAPHSNFEFERSGKQESDAPRYAERHAHLFKDYEIPRTEDFNPATQGGVGWISKLPRLNESVLAYNDEFQRSRLRALQSVDESLEQLIGAIEEAGQLDDTYIFYTTDNGYHISQKRLHPGKECGFDTDINIPLVVRGPGIRKGHVSYTVTAHTDIASTVLGLAGVTRDDSDGLAIPLTAEQEKSGRHDHVNIEFWGLGIPEGKYGSYGDEDMNDGEGFKAHAVGNNTYKGLRIVNDEYSLYYSVWCTNEHELYDVKNDPHQIHNLLSPSSASNTQKSRIAHLTNTLHRPLTQILSRLDALLLVLKSCKGSTCTHPWRALHPDGSVATLKQSLAKQFDAFYEQQPAVSFTRCELGYIKDAEGPFEFERYGEKQQRQQRQQQQQQQWDDELRDGEAVNGDVNGDVVGDDDDAFVGPVESEEALKRKGYPVTFKYRGQIGMWT